jgi:hypothetical protein
MILMQVANEVWYFTHKTQMQERLRIQSSVSWMRCCVWDGRETRCFKKHTSNTTMDIADIKNFELIWNLYLNQQPGLSLRESELICHFEWCLQLKIVTKLQRPFRFQCVGCCGRFKQRKSCFKRESR